MNPPSTVWVPLNTRTSCTGASEKVVGENQPDPNARSRTDWKGDEIERDYRNLTIGLKTRRLSPTTLGVLETA